MTVVAVLPSIWQPHTDACLSTISDKLASTLLLIDNTKTNRGVAASWNEGLTQARRNSAEWLVILSASIRFGRPGGDDFLRQLDDTPAEAWACEAGEQPRRPGHGFGWHLIAFRTRTFDRAGTFDENFWPAYWEDCDFGHRVRVASLRRTRREPCWPKVDVDAGLTGYAQGAQAANVVVEVRQLAAYYARKWGGPPGHEQFWHPFGDRRLSVGWWPHGADPRAVLRNRQPGT